MTFNQVVRGSSPRWLIKISDIILYLIFFISALLFFCSIIYRRNSADMAELADALDLGSSVNRRLQVQLLLSASKKAIIIDCLFFLSDILLLIIQNYTGHLHIILSCKSIIIIQLITTSLHTQVTAASSYQYLQHTQQSQQEECIFPFRINKITSFNGTSTK